MHVGSLAVLDGTLLSAWALLSTLLVSTLAGGLAATAARARRWRPDEIDGVPVLRSRDVGPAVIGVGRPFLEQRIERMTERGSGMSRMQTALIVAGAVGVLAAAWALPQPVRAARVGGSVGAYCPIDTSKVAAKVLYGLDWTS